MKLFNIILSVFISFLLLTDLKAQNPDFEWAIGEGGSGFDQAESIVTDSRGNVYITGFFRNIVDFDPSSGVSNLVSNGAYDIFIQKIDPLGNLVWIKQIGSSSNEEALAITVDQHDNIYTTGDFEGTADFDPGPAVFNLSTSGGKDIFIQKLDLNGNFVWAKKIGGTSVEIGRSIDTDSEGNLIIIGSFNGTADFNPGVGVANLTSLGSNDLFILKLDTLGNFDWVKQIGGSNAIVGESIKTSFQNNIYVTGHFKDSVDFDPGVSNSNLYANGSEDSFVLKLNKLGNFVWVRHLDGIGLIHGLALSTDLFGNVYTTGKFTSTVDLDPSPATSLYTSNGQNDIFIQKLDSLGNFIWSKQMGGIYSDEGVSISTDRDGNIYTSGYFSNIVDFNPSASAYNLTPKGNGDIFIQKLDSAGNFKWAKQMGGNTSFGIGKAITVDTNYNIYTAGHFDKTVDFNPNGGITNKTSAAYWDIFIQKLSQCSNSFAIDSITSCNSFTWINGITYTTSNNIAKDTLVNSTGCDSIISLALTILNSNTGIDSVVTCNSFQWINGINYTANNNTATFNILNGAKNGCDSLVTLNLTIINSSTSIDSDTISDCNSYTWIDGKSYTSSNNTATFNIVNGAANGCDSIITLNLTVLNPPSGIDTVVKCDAFRWINGVNYTTSNNTATFNIIGGAQNGCDSLVSLDLTILNSSVSFAHIVACNSYTWVDGITYTTSNNTAKDTLINTIGCDSIITLNLTINKVSNITTSTNGPTITANNANGTYQWLNCDSNYSIIQNEISRSFSANVNGNYAVEITENGCIDTSNCVNISTVGLFENINSQLINIYPNPTTGYFTMEMGIASDNTEISIFNIHGKLISRQTINNSNITQLDLTNQPSGIYFTMVKLVNESFTVKIIKE